MPSQSEDLGQVVSRGIWPQLRQKPQPLLGKRERCWMSLHENDDTLIARTRLFRKAHSWCATVRYVDSDQMMIRTKPKPLKSRGAAKKKRSRKADPREARNIQHADAWRLAHRKATVNLSAETVTFERIASK